MHNVFENTFVFVKRFMITIPVLLFMYSNGIAKTNTPQFADYRVDIVYKGVNHPLVINSFGKSYKTRLNYAIKNSKPDFAGKYIVVRWGCGSAGGNAGAIINAETGQAYPFPVSMSSVLNLKPQYADEDGQEFIYRMNSRLMIFAGNLDGSEYGNGADTVEFYEFRNNKFIFIKSVPYNKSAGEEY